MEKEKKIEAKNLLGKKILVVDDVKINYILIKGLLKDSGAEVVWAADGNQAIDRFHHFGPDLILMDYHMPGMNGFQAATAIKREKEALPIICQTTDWKEMQKEDRKLVFNDILFKPITKNNLLKKISKNMV